MSTQNELRDIFFDYLERNMMEEMENMLKEGLVDINVKNSKGLTALQEAIALPNYLKKCVKLIKWGINLDIKSNKGNTALILAIMKYKLDIAEILIRKGANVNIKNNEQDTAFHWLFDKCRENDCLKFLKLFHEYGADFNIKGFHNKTILEIAYNNGYLDVVKYLLKNGAVPLNKDRYGKDVLYYSMHNNDFDTFKLCMVYVDNPNSIKYNNHQDNVSVYYLDNMSINNNDVLTIPMVAGLYGNKNSIIYILNNYKNYNINYFTETYNTLYNSSDYSIQDYLNNRNDIKNKINRDSKYELKKKFNNKLLSNRIKNKGLDLFINEYANDYLFGQKKKTKKSRKKSKNNKPKKSKSKK